MKKEKGKYICTCIQAHTRIHLYCVYMYKYQQREVHKDLKIFSNNNNNDNNNNTIYLQITTDIHFINMTTFTDKHHNTSSSLFINRGKAGHPLIGSAVRSPACPQSVLWQDTEGCTISV